MRVPIFFSFHPFDPMAIELTDDRQADAVYIGGRDRDSGCQLGAGTGRMSVADGVTVRRSNSDMVRNEFSSFFRASFQSL